MRIAEIFYSIQGEGPAMGRPADFVRLAGCNLRCEGCDTFLENWKEISPEEVLDQVVHQRVIITGGEPTLQTAELSRLIALLHKKGREVHIETNGTNIIADSNLERLHYAVVSPKRGSQVDLAFWAQRVNVHLKFVIGPENWCWPAGILDELVPALPSERVWLMPFGIDPELKYAEVAWDLALRLGVNYSDRLHIRLRRR